MNFVVGAFAFHQTIDSDPSFVQEQGSAAARFLLAPSANAATPGLLDGYGYHQYVDYGNTSAAVFGQVAWSVTDRLRMLPGLRFNYDQKDVDFDQQVYGGLQTTDPALIALQQSILAPQAYAANVSDTNASGQLTVGYKLASRVNAYATYATGFKSVGLNLNGVPTDAPISRCCRRPRSSRKTLAQCRARAEDRALRWRDRQLHGLRHEIKNFQAQVTNGSVGVIRGYLANADKVRVRGAEFDGSARLDARRVTVWRGRLHGRQVRPLRGRAAAARSDRRTAIPGHLRFLLPGISQWALYVRRGVRPSRVACRAAPGQLFGALDASYRSWFSSSATYSPYLVVDGYSLLNVRVGFRAAEGWTFTLWSRNVLNKDYYELLTAAPGNTGLYVGQPGDARTVGLTLRVALRSR